jgi:hypothetical protein
MTSVRFTGDGVPPGRVSMEREGRPPSGRSEVPVREEGRPSSGLVLDCSVNFLFFELSCEILCERNFFFVVFRKLEVVRC